MRRMEILLAEDNVVNQRLAARLLEKRGHAVTVAVNVREAVETLERRRFDVVLMDMQMPELDGFETTALIRQKEQQSDGHVPIITMTAHALKEDRERCLAASMDGYVSKPLQLERLLEAIEVYAVSPAESPITLDRAAALQRVGGDAELLKEILDLFEQEYPQCLAEIASAIQERDRAAHNFKGSLGNFGDSAPVTTAQALEAMGHENSLAGAQETYQQLVRLQPALAALVNTNSGTAAVRIGPAG